MRVWMIALLSVSLMSPAALAAGKKRHDPPPPVAPDQPIAAPHGDFILRTLSYNVHGLPLPIFVDHSHYDDIGKYLYKLRTQGTAPHVVAIQEAFHSKTWQLVTYSGYPYVTVGAQGDGLRTSAGLIILSEYPIELSDEMVFSDCASFDCFSRKGVLHARIRVPGLPAAIDFFDTHMQASYRALPSAKMAENIRQKQLIEIKDFWKNVRDTALPGIFGGDFNFRADRKLNAPKNFPFFVQFSGMEDSGRACKEFLSCTGDPSKVEAWQTQIDHMFYASGQGEGAMQAVPVGYDRIFEDASDGGVQSDHPGIFAHFKLSW